MSALASVRPKVKIKLLQGICGNELHTVGEGKNARQEARSYFAHQPGVELDWDAEEAQRFADRGIAQIIRPAGK